MFAAPNPDALRDVEAQRAAQATAPPQQQYVTSTTSVETQMKGGNAMAQPGATTTQGATQTGQGKSSIVRVAESMRWGTQMMLIAFFSMLVMIISAQVCDAYNSNNCYALRGYQVAVGAISLIIALLVALVNFAGRLTDPKTMTLISTFFFLWWLAGVIVLTYIGDFTTTANANGYFGSWGAFIISMFSLVAVSPRFESGLDQTMHSVRKPLFFLVVASAVVMGAAIDPCSPASQCNSYNAYALVVGIVSLFFALVLFFLPTQIEYKMLKGFSVAFVIWWLFGTAVTTLGGPFRTTGNGYFGCFAALFASVNLLQVLHRENRGAA